MHDDSAAAFLALASKATPGPWVAFDDKLRSTGVGSHARIHEVQQGGHKQPPVVNWEGFEDSDRTHKGHAANVLFIVAARNDAPALVRDLLTEVTRLRDALRHYYNTPGHQNCGCDACSAARALLAELPQGSAP